jgi:cardiolipin synthase
MEARTSQGAIAWALGLVMFPWLTLPFFWVFGHHKFGGRVERRKSSDLLVSRDLLGQGPLITDCKSVVSGDFKLLEYLVSMPFTKGNRVDLLINGEETFDRILAAIEKAESYVLAQFFIVKNDHLGKKFLEALAGCARRGVRVYFLYDPLGSRSLSRSNLIGLKRAGVHVSSFGAKRSGIFPFRLNFRNHRKVVIIDGVKVFVGGHNVGDEYMGGEGHWRDTHIEIEGPAALMTQMPFVEDWHWSCGDILGLNWQVSHPMPGDEQVLVLPSGPSDQFETCGLFFVHAAGLAKQRLWIASPYFVPDGKLQSALSLAALRGVDVRVLLPGRPDHLMVYYARYDYISSLQKSGVKFFIYREGFLHQKVLLLDNVASSVGTANIDNRSFRLNFEITMLTLGESVAQKVEEMLVRDFKASRELEPFDMGDKSWFFRLAVKICRLFSPIL